MSKRLFKVLAIYAIVSLCAILLVNLVDFVNFECLYKKLLNMYCAGCGVTRMFESMFHLDFYQAFRFNPFMFILVIFFFIFSIVNSIRYIIGKKMYRLPLKVIIAIGISLAIYMVLRNIPGFEFLLPKEV